MLTHNCLCYPQLQRYGSVSVAKARVLCAAHPSRSGAKMYTSRNLANCKMGFSAGSSIPLSMAMVLTSNSASAGWSDHGRWWI